MSSRIFTGVTAAVILATINSLSPGQSVPSPSADLSGTERSNYVSSASFLIATASPAEVQRTAEGRQQAADAWLQTLTPYQRQTATRELTDAERRAWTNLPAPRDAGGIRLGDLDETQLRAAAALLASLVSEHGYQKIRNIMLADDQLLRNGQPRPGFGTENFSIVIFGKPSATDPWAFQIDGHHVGFNLAIAGERVTMAPSFIGTQPHRFSIGEVEIQPFSQESGLAYQLATSLTDDQVRAAVLGPQRGRILTGPGTDGNYPDSQGLRCDQLDADQQATLWKLISQWVNDLPEDLAGRRMEELKAEVGQMYFSWNGGRAAGSDVSYRIQSPSLVIEYACQNLGGNPLDHLHSMYRNPQNDYGGQLK